jgi:hypothetical protein
MSIKITEINVLKEKKALSSRGVDLSCGVVYSTFVGQGERFFRIFLDEFVMTQGKSGP